MFKEALKEIVDRTEGGIAGVVMDANGITLEQYAKDGAAFDINIVGIEYNGALASVRKASEMLEAGSANEIAIGTDKLVTLIRFLRDGYFLALALAPGGNLGKGRFLMRTAAPKIIAELA